MFDKNLKRPLATLAVTAGLLAVAGPASADIQSPRDPSSGIHRSPSANEVAIESLDAFRPEINDEVLVLVDFEMDVFW